MKKEEKEIEIEIEPRIVTIKGKGKIVVPCAKSFEDVKVRWKGFVDEVVLNVIESSKLGPEASEAVKVMGEAMTTENLNEKAVKNLAEQVVREVPDLITEMSKMSPELVAKVDALEAVDPNLPQAEATDAAKVIYPNCVAVMRDLDELADRVTPDLMAKLLPAIWSMGDLVQDKAIDLIMVERPLTILGRVSDMAVSLIVNIKTHEIFKIELENAINTISAMKKKAVGV